MKLNRVVLAAALALSTVFAALVPADLHAQTNADIARNAFQVTEMVNINNFVYTPVAIPTGKRLVIQSVSLSGAATTTSGPFVVPIVLLNASINGAGANLVYFAPTQNAQDPSQFYSNNQLTIYADTLAVGPAFAGFTPNFMSFNIVISGYLVDLPRTEPAADSR